MTNIQDAIDNYIRSNSNISPSDMINDLLPRFYPLNDIESKITFELVLDAAKYFTTIIKRTDLCVEQSMLYKYKVLSLQKNKCGNYVEQQTDISRMLKQCKSLVEGSDYQARKLPGLARGGHKPMQYTMTPKAFFMCLIRSGKTSVYAEYYFHVLELYNYYESYYTKMYKEKIEDLEDEVIMTDSEIIHREKRIDFLEELMAKLDRNHLEIMNQSKSQYEIIQEKSKEMQKQLSELNSKIDKMSMKLPECINVPPKEDLTEWLVLMMKPNTNKLYIIRTQLISLPTTIAKKEKDGYVKIDGLPETELVPNAMSLWNVAKTKMTQEKMISCRYNNIILHCHISIFIERLNKIFISRKDY